MGISVDIFMGWLARIMMSPLSLPLLLALVAEPELRKRIPSVGTGKKQYAQFVSEHKYQWKNRKMT